MWYSINQSNADVYSIKIALFTVRLVIGWQQLLHAVSITILLALPWLAHATEACQPPTSSHTTDLIKQQDAALAATTAVNPKPLRVLVHHKANQCILTRKEQQLIEQFAKTNQLAVHWIYVDSVAQLLPSLLAEKGDLIAAQDLSLAAETKVKATLPWASRNYKIVQRVNNSRIDSYENLVGRNIAIYQDSPVLIKLRQLAQTLPGIMVTEIPATMSYPEIMTRIKTGKYDIALVDSLFVDQFLSLNLKTLQADFNVLEKQQHMAWLVRADADVLHTKLNQYLNQQALTHHTSSSSIDDLPMIKNRGVLRIITNLETAHYYVENGELRGFEYELLANFAAKQKLRLDVILANSQTELLQLLKNGKGDIVAASLPQSVLARDSSIEFTRAYNYASPVVIGRSNDKGIIDLQDLAGKKIVLNDNSPYWEYMLRLQQSGIMFELIKYRANLENTLAMVADSKYDVSIISSHQINKKYLQTLGLSTHFSLSEPRPLSWVVRSNNTLLIKALNSYLTKEYRKSYYNVLYAQYFEQQDLASASINNTTLSLSPYDALIKAAAAQHHFDWRLIVAVMFQESRFDPNAYSRVGAAGLMQLIVSTAQQMGVKDITDPEDNINAGIGYLSYLRNKFEATLSLQDRMWFTLASYNAGYNRVRYARKLAKEMGLNQNLWFNNVELAMLSIRNCRCGETIAYVKKIRTRYFNYIRLLDMQKTLNQSPRKINAARLINTSL